MTKLISVLFYLLLIKSSLASAFFNENKYDSNTLLLDDLIQLVLVNSYDVKTSKIERQIAVQNVGQQLSEFYPRLDVSLGLSNIKKFGNIPGIDSVLLQGQDDINSANAVASLSLNLYRGGYNMSAYKASVIGKNFSNQKIKHVRFLVIKELIELYHSLKSAKINYKIANLKLILEKKYLTMNLIAFKDGTITAVAVEKNKDKIQNIEAALIHYDYKAKTYNSILLELSGKNNVVNNINSTEEESQEIIVNTLNENYIDILKSLNIKKGKNFELLQLEQEYKKAKYEIDKAKSKYKPKIDLSTQYTYSALDQDNIINAYRDITKDKRQIGLIISWNIFEGFATDTGYRTAQLRRQKLKVNILNKQRKLFNDKKQITLKISSINENIYKQRNEMNLYEIELKIMQQEYKHGLINKLDMHNKMTKIKIIELEIIDKENQVNLLEVDKFALGTMNLSFNKGNR
ncbi:MAG: outer membrane protein [Alteromonadaceae bacterium]|jgi:outer membrane protein